MEKGDLVQVVEALPDWDHLNYHTGDVGMIVSTKDLSYGYLVCRVYIFAKDHIAVIPEHYLKKLKEIK